MKKIFYSLVVAAITLLSVQQASATHIMGMNITYKHINGDTFVMNLDFFRYCGGTAFNNGNCTGAAGIGSIAGDYARCEDNGWQGNRQAQADTIREATPICDSLNSTQNSTKLNIKLHTQLHPQLHTKLHTELHTEQPPYLSF